MIITTYNDIMYYKYIKIMIYSNQNAHQVVDFNLYTLKDT